MLPTHKQLSPKVRQRNLAMNWLLETYPNAFDLRNRQPLQANILDEVFKRGLPENVSKDDLYQAYYHYTHWGSYLLTLKEGAYCINLDGNKDGVVTEKQAKAAEQQLKQAQDKQRPV